VAREQPPTTSAVEIHEAQAWAAWVEATASVIGNPLRAEVDRSGSTPLPIVALLDSRLLNRVIAFGAIRPASEPEIEHLLAFYATRHQLHFQIEISPGSQPADLVEALLRRGLVDARRREAKLLRSTRDPPDETRHLVRALSSEDRDGWIRVNRMAWGFPKVTGAWFGATLAQEPFHHFGVFQGGELVSTGAMYVSDGLAWLGFDATAPNCQGQGMQSATIARRVHAAATMGCRWVHSETAVDTLQRRSRSMHNMLDLGFDLLYEKRLLEPRDV
jgi:hypothetical protein